MIIVTGATGVPNGGTVDELLNRVPADEIVVVARDTAKAQSFADRGVAVRRGDYADPDSLPVAFAGVDQLLLVSSSDPGADAVSLHRAAIDAAVTAGVQRILYTSHQGAALDTPFGPGRDHAATEQLLADSGVAWTSLRNGFHAHSLNWLMGPWRETGSFAVPADGPVSWTAREDAAEAAAVILASNGAYDGPTTLTASAAPTFEEIAAIASELTGSTIEVTFAGSGRLGRRPGRRRAEGVHGPLHPRHVPGRFRGLLRRSRSAARHIARPPTADRARPSHPTNRLRASLPRPGRPGSQRCVCAAPNKAPPARPALTEHWTGIADRNAVGSRVDALSRSIRDARHLPGPGNSTLG